MIEVSFVTGPLLTAVIVALPGPEVALGLSAVLVIAGTVVFLARLPGAEPRKLPADTPPGLLGPLGEPAIRMIALTTLPVGFCIGTIEVALPAFSDARGEPGARRRPARPLVVGERDRRARLRRPRCAPRPGRDLSADRGALPARLPAACRRLLTGGDGRPGDARRAADRAADREPQRARRRRSPRPAPGPSRSPGCSRRWSPGSPPAQPPRGRSPRPRVGRPRCSSAARSQCSAPPSRTPAEGRFGPARRRPESPSQPCATESRPSQPAIEPSSTSSSPRVCGGAFGSRWIARARRTPAVRSAFRSTRATSSSPSRKGST